MLKRHADGEHRRTDADGVRRTGRVLNAKKFTAAIGDAVTVSGAPLPNRPDVILARQIKKGEMTLVLRDPQGWPEWRKGRRREG